MRSAFRNRFSTAKFIVIAAVFTATGLFAGCGDPSSRIDVGGTWLWEDGQYQEKYVITNTRLEKYNSFTTDDPHLIYSISQIYNGEFNGDENGSGSYGCALISLSSGSDYYDDVIGYYTIFRWQNLKTSEDGITTADLTIGLFDPENDLTYFKNKDEAFAEVTAANGYFTSYSTGCELQETE